MGYYIVFYVLLKSLYISVNRRHAYPIIAATDRIMAITDKIIGMVPMRFSGIMATTDRLREKNPGRSEKKWIMKLCNFYGFYSPIGSILYSSERFNRSRHSSPSKTMKSILLYIAAIAVAMNVAGNLAANTAEGLKASQAARTEKLCAVNPVYCD